MELFAWGEPRFYSFLEIIPASTGIVQKMDLRPWRKVREAIFSFQRVRNLPTPYFEIEHDWSNLFTGQGGARNVATMVRAKILVLHKSSPERSKKDFAKYWRNLM